MACVSSERQPPLKPPLLGVHVHTWCVQVGPTLFPHGHMHAIPELRYCRRAPDLSAQAKCQYAVLYSCGTDVTVL